jgi:hypothetical protein
VLQLFLRIFYPISFGWLHAFPAVPAAGKIVVVVLGTVGFAGSCLVCVCNAMMMGDNIMEGLITRLVMMMRTLLEALSLSLSLSGQILLVA